MQQCLSVVFGAYAECAQSCRPRCQSLDAQVHIGGTLASQDTSNRRGPIASLPRRVAEALASPAATTSVESHDMPHRATREGGHPSLPDLLGHQG
jgi:hypothetical protein